jgi:hypothetical protein
MRKIRNKRELELMKKNLELEQMMYEKRLLSNTTAFVTDFTDGLKSAAIEWGVELALRILFGSRNQQTEND